MSGDRLRYELNRGRGASHALPAVHLEVAVDADRRTLSRDVERLAPTTEIGT